MYKVGIIGAGKVGVSLGIYLFNRGDLRLNGFYSRSIDSANYGADRTNTKAYSKLEEIVGDCEVLIITTPDDEIENTWSKIKQYNIKDKIICHCSGSLSSSIFFDSTTKEADCCSFHPMLAISSKEHSYKALRGAFFTLEGDFKAVNLISKTLEANGNPYKILSSQDKRKYHLATVCISNLVIGLGSIAMKLLEDYGFSNEEAREAMSSLGMRNLEAFFEKGPIEALTGPVERADVKTVQGHLKSISDSSWDLERQVYIDLSKILVRIAEEKNPKRNYNSLLEELKKGDSGQ